MTKSWHAKYSTQNGEKKGREWKNKNGRENEKRTVRTIGVESERRRKVGQFLIATRPLRDRIPGSSFSLFTFFHAGNRSFSYFSRVRGGTGKNSTTKHRWKSEAIDEWIPYNRAHPLFLPGFIVFVRFVNLLPCYRGSMRIQEKDFRSKIILIERPFDQRCFVEQKFHDSALVQT